MNDEQIEKIKSAIEAADHIPAEKKAELLALFANLKLKESVEKFEASHPDLAAFVNRYSTLLSALGF